MNENHLIILHNMAAGVVTDFVTGQVSPGDALGYEEAPERHQRILSGYLENQQKAIGQLASVDIALLASIR